MESHEICRILYEVPHVQDCAISVMSHRGAFYLGLQVKPVGDFTNTIPRVIATTDFEYDFTKTLHAS